MRKLFVLFAFIVSLFATSCITYHNVDKNSKKVSLGMTKDEVVSVMGKSYKVVSISNERAGQLEVLSYEGMSDDWIYMFYFLDGKLDRMQKEFVGTPYPHRPANESKDY